MGEKITMEIKSGKTEMVADQSKKTEMVAASKVKIKAVRTIELKDGRQVKKGEIVEVSEDEAKEFADKVFKGQYAFAGERFNDIQRHNVVRAVRVS